MQPMSDTLLDRVKRLLPDKDAQPEWGNPMLSTTPSRLALHNLAMRVEALEEAVRQLASEVEQRQPSP